MTKDSTIVADVAGIATGLGVLAVWWQLVLARRQLRSNFEQGFTDRYEKVIGRAPLALILGDSTAATDDGVRRAFYDYFKLCEEELYYRAEGRVSRRTWSDWYEGIALHLRRPAFRAAWEDLKDRTVIIDGGSQRLRLEQFTYLRAAIQDVDAGRHDPHRSRSHEPPSASPMPESHPRSADAGTVRATSSEDQAPLG